MSEHEAADKAAEADEQEQSEVVEEQQVFVPAPRGDDVPEADWLEQSIEEVPEEEER
ncbi:MAG TPA: hypothetical protein VFN50_04585 [Acidimicrobiales bacterium]|nr:hypothetical protein [Acidimicrobiales bacterium]